MTSHLLVFFLGTRNSYANVRGVCEEIPVHCQAPCPSYLQQMVWKLESEIFSITTENIYMYCGIFNKMEHQIKFRGRHVIVINLLPSVLFIRVTTVLAGQ